MTAPLRQGRALAFIFVTVLIDSIGFGVVIPVLPELIMKLTGRDLGGAATMTGWLILVYSLMQFVCAPIIGGLSDRFGRRPVLLASLLAFGIDYLVTAFAPSIGFLFAARAVAGITGATFGTAYAYIADISPPERRAANFGITGMGFGLGFIIGPVAGGLLASRYGVQAPFIAAGALALANFAWGWFVLPESLARENRRAFDWRRANPVGALLRLRRYRPVVLSLAAVTFLWMVGFQSLPVTWNYFVIARFGWGPDAIGISLAAVGLVAVVMQGGVSRIIIPRLGERRIVVLGVCSAVAAYLIYAFSVTGWQLYTGIVVGALSGLVYQSLQSLMSREVEADEQGELQGTVASVFSLATVIGPPLMTQTFAAFTRGVAGIVLPGAAFILSALLALAALAVFVAARPRAAATADPSGTG